MLEEGWTDVQLEKFNQTSDGRLACEMLRQVAIDLGTLVAGEGKRNPLQVLLIRNTKV